MKLFYEGDEEYDVQVYDEVAVVAAEYRFPATIKKIIAKRKQVIVSFEGIDPVLDLIILRKSARVPIDAVEFQRRPF